MSKLVEPEVGSCVRDRGRFTALVGQGAPHTLEAHAHDPSFGAHALDAIERVAKPSLAQADQPAELGNWHRSLDVSPYIRLGQLDGLLPRNRDDGSASRHAPHLPSHGRNPTPAKDA